MKDKPSDIDSIGVLSVIVLIRKRMIAGIMLWICIFGSFATIVCNQYLVNGTTVVFAANDDVPVTVVLDSGHGGEDGGAVSPDGVEESHINLAIALKVNDLLRFTGQRTLMTRTEDVSIHTEGTSIRARKASDIRNRVALVDSVENAILLSIHQNSLPSSKVTHGAQVFWNTEAGAEELARVVQDSLNTSVNPENPKQAKQIPATIYLMKHVTAPAILVECGFLSNVEETTELQNPSYQLKLATAITTGYLRCLSGDEVT